VVYTCGPERMMQFVAGYCADRGIECYACMERSMACGMGTCQSCVVPVRNESDEQGWSYRLCCTEGPVFNAREIIWEPMSIS
ncbi:MAG: dihydroorotate dehydrogenase electron transfer subunit, partial [Dehalococcoidia bacterium]